MRRTAVVFTVALITLALRAVPSNAQTNDGPKAGTWGAEASSLLDASLLRFRSSTSAWILGFSYFYLHEEREQTGLTPSSSDEDRFRGQVRLGVRGYRRPQERFRPFTTLSGVVGYDGGSFTGWHFGGVGELGGAYFFTPHVSLGVAAAMSVFYQKLRDEFSGQAVEIKLFSVQSSGFRLLGAVYF